MRSRYIFLMIFLMGSIQAQTTVNPDISVIGELGLTLEDNTSTMNASSVELAIQGYVNPYARVDVYLHKHMDEAPIELEEAVLSIERGLPLGMALRAGKFRPDFGKINRQHLHIFPQIVLPEPVAEILGEEKWSAAGLEAKWLLPLPWYSNLSLAYLQEGISNAEHHHDAEVTDAEEAENVGEAFSARYSMFFDLGIVSHLEIGGSYYQVLEETEINVMALDLKYKWRPDKYRSLAWQNEVFRRNQYDHLDEGVTEHHPEVIAAYSQLNYQFRKVWNAGAIIDYSSHLEEAAYHSEGLFVGFSPAEETTVLRVFLKQEHHGDEESTSLVQAQLLWSLGPHKAHQF